MTLSNDFTSWAIRDCHLVISELKGNSLIEQHVGKALFAVSKGLGLWPHSKRVVCTDSADRWRLSLAISGYKDEAPVPFVLVRSTEDRQLGFPEW